MTKNKTALEELIYWGKVIMKKYPPKELSFSEVIDKAEMLLETEKNQLKNAYNQGHIDRQKGIFNEKQYDT